MESIHIPCQDCEDTKRRYELRGYRVSGCEALAEIPGICRFNFELPGQAVPMALLQPAAAAADTAMPAAGLTSTQIGAAQALVNVFETDAVRGRYGQVTLIPGDTGRLTYGRSQTTLGSGNLYKMLHTYCSNVGARFGHDLQMWLPKIGSQDASVDVDLLLHNLLRAAADDPLMREIQDRFFDETYWQPAHKAATKHGIFSPLGVAVVYDSHVHGFWGPLKKVVDTRLGAPAQAGEAAWISAYIAERRRWLAMHPSRPDLHKTVYRMDAFMRLIELGLWGLTLPFVVRGHEISALSLTAPPPDCYDGPQPGTRVLELQQPMLSGLDVRLTQLALSRQGLSIKADGIYGRNSRDLVRAWQMARGLPDTGRLDPATIVSLTG